MGAETHGTEIGGTAEKYPQSTQLVALAASLVIIGVAYSDTFAGMIDVWFRSQTYLHGIVILPISGYLIAMRLKDRDIRQSSPYWPAFLCLVALSMAWFMFDFLAVEAGMHFVVVAMLPVTVVAIMGKRFAGSIAFPLAYLFFAVPFGDFLVPTLVEFTAQFTVAALKLTGIPVFRYDQYLTMPAGSFEVARACSGIRYLLASIALGTLFAYLVYSSLKKRLIFIGFSIVFPIVANGIRAYAIVLVAYFSDMRLAVGIDHIIFGWVFFGFVIAVMFLFGLRFRDDEDQNRPDTVGTAIASGNSNRRLPFSMAWAAALAALCVIAVSPGQLAAEFVEQHQKDDIPSPLYFPQIEGWRGPFFDVSDWNPAYRNPSAAAVASYVRDGISVEIALVLYRGVKHDSELVNSANQIADPALWRYGVAKTQRLDAHTPIDMINSILLADRRGSRIVWYWYEVNGSRALSPTKVKMLEAGRMLLLESSKSTLVAVSSRVTSDLATAQSVLKSFIFEAGEAIRYCMSEESERIQCARFNEVGEGF